MGKSRERSSSFSLEAEFPSLYSALSQPSQPSRRPPVRISGKRRPHTSSSNSPLLLPSSTLPQIPPSSPPKCHSKPPATADPVLGGLTSQARHRSPPSFLGEPPPPPSAQGSPLQLLSSSSSPNPPLCLSKSPLTQSYPDLEDAPDPVLGHPPSNARRRPPPPLPGDPPPPPASQVSPPHLSCSSPPPKTSLHPSNSPMFQVLPDLATADPVAADSTLGARRRRPETNLDPPPPPTSLYSSSLPTSSSSLPLNPPRNPSFPSLTQPLSPSHGADPDPVSATPPLSAGLCTTAEVQSSAGMDCTLQPPFLNSNSSCPPSSSLPSRSNGAAVLQTSCRSDITLPQNAPPSPLVSPQLPHHASSHQVHSRTHVTQPPSSPTPFTSSLPSSPFSATNGRPSRSRHIPPPHNGKGILPSPPPWTRYWPPQPPPGFAYLFYMLPLQSLHGHPPPLRRHRRRRPRRRVPTGPEVSSSPSVPGPDSTISTPLPSSDAISSPLFASTATPQTSPSSVQPSEAVRPPSAGSRPSARTSAAAQPPSAVTCPLMAAAQSPRTFSEVVSSRIVADLVASAPRRLGSVPARHTPPQTRSRSQLR